MHKNTQNNIGLERPAWKQNSLRACLWGLLVLVAAGTLYLFFPKLIFPLGAAGFDALGDGDTCTISAAYAYPHADCIRLNLAKPFSGILNTVNKPSGNDGTKQAEQ